MLNADDITGKGFILRRIGTGIYLFLRLNYWGWIRPGLTYAYT